MSHKLLTHNGFIWVYDEDGAHFYQKKVGDSYYLMRLLPTDLPIKNFQYMAANHLTNTNKAPSLTYLWRYNKASGTWACVRDATDAKEWLAKLKQDEPEADFKLAKTRPRLPPKIQTNIEGDCDEVLQRDVSVN